MGGSGRRRSTGRSRDRIKLEQRATLVCAVAPLMDDRRFNLRRGGRLDPGHVPEMTEIATMRRVFVVLVNAGNQRQRDEHRA